MIAARLLERIAGSFGALCLAVMAVGYGLSSAVPSAVESTISPAKSIVLPSGYGQYFYVGSTSGGKPMESISWSPDLAVIASYSDNEAISIGRSTSASGAYSTLTGSDAIAGAALNGYTVKEVFRASATATGPGYSGGPETPAVGESLELHFTTQSEDLVLILIGGEGTGELQLSGLTATTLQNATYSAGSDVLASAAIYSATLPTGDYTAQWSSTTYLTNSGTSLGAVAYVLQPSSPTTTIPTTTTAPKTTATTPTTTATQPNSPAPPHSPVLVAAFSPSFATRANLMGRSLGVLLGIPSITGIRAGSTVTIRCRHACSRRLKVVRHVGKHDLRRPIRLRRVLVLRRRTIVQISVSQRGHVGRFVEYRFKRTRLGVVPYVAGRGCLGPNGVHETCV